VSTEGNKDNEGKPLPPSLPSFASVQNPQSAIRNPQSSITNDIQYAAGFVPEKSEIALGEPLSVAFKLTNTSDRTIYLEVGRTDPGMGNPFRFRATDAQGNSVPDPSLVPNQLGKTPIGLGGDYLNPFSAIWGLNAATPIDPGRIYSERVILSAGGIFKQPGEYSIIASREIHLYKDRIVRPGSQRDFSATGYETFPPDVLSTNGAVSQRLTNVFKLKILSAPPLSNSPASDWGEPVNGFQVRLRAPVAAGPGDAPPRLSVDIANLGLREFYSMTNYFAWQVEVDGQWYTSDADMGGAELEVVPGQPWTNLPLVLDSAWRVAEPQEIGVDPGRFGNGGWGYPGKPPLKLSPGKHTVRLAVVAVVAGPRFAGGGEPVRALSNPVDIEVRTNVSTGSPGTNATGSTSENPQSAIRNPQSAKGPETILAELRNILPEDWTCQLTLKPGEIKGPTGPLASPLFRIDFTNFNILIREGPGSGAWPRPVHPHPYLRLYFLPLSEKARFEQRTVGGEPVVVGVGETPDYFVVTSVPDINSGRGSVELDKATAPLGRALEKYFGKFVTERIGGLLGLSARAPDGLTTGIGITGQVVDDQTGKPINAFYFQWNADNPQQRTVYYGGRFGSQFRQDFGGWIMVEFFNSGMSDVESGEVFADGQKLWPHIEADGYLTEPVTPEPVVWPVELTNIVVRLKRAGASAQPATNAPASAPANPQSAIRNPQLNGNVSTEGNKDNEGKPLPPSLPSFASVQNPQSAIRNPQSPAVPGGTPATAGGTPALPNPQSAIRNPQSLSGRVVDDATGEPIVNFVVQTSMSNSTNPERSLWAPVSSGNPRTPGLFDGIPSPSPQQRLCVSASGYMPEPLTEELMMNAPASGLEVRLKRGGEIHGVVLEAAGQPVSGARVFLTTLQRLYLNEGRQFGNIYNGSSTTTDNEGRFVLRGTGGTLQRVAVVSPDGFMIWPAVQSGPGEDLKVALPKPGTLIVSYDNPRDDPQAKLNLGFMTLTNGPEEKSFWTNLWFSRSLMVANGSETILTNMTPGTYDISRSKTTAYGSFAIIERQSVVMEPGQTQRLDVAGTNGQRIRGQVVGLDLVKATGGSISVRSAEATGQHWPMGSQNSAKEALYPTFDLLQFGADGTFQTTALKPGTYSVIAEVFPPRDNSGGSPSFLRKPGYVGVAKITVAADAMPLVSIKLAPALFVDIAGEVVDGETGAPLRKVMIQRGAVNQEKPGEIKWREGLEETGQGAPALRTGQFSLRDVKAGTALRFLANGYVPQTIPRDEGIAATQTNGLLVRLKRGGELHGVVHDCAGAPVADANVILAPAELGQSLLATISMPNSGAEAFTSTATTDATGRFSLRGAGDRPRVLVFAFDSRMAQAAQPAAPGRELNITLPAPATLIVRYDIPGDTPGAVFKLRLCTNGLEMPLWKDLTSYLWEAVTNGTQIAVSNLAPGTYDFSRWRLDMATNSDGIFMFGEPAEGVISDNQKVVLESGRAQQINLVRSAGQRVQGQLTWVQPITNLEEAFLYVGPAPLIITPSDYKTNMFQPCFDVVKVDQDGHFQTALLEPGDYTLVVEGYVKGERPKPRALADDEPQLTGFAGPLPLRLAYAANAKVTVTTNAPPPPVKIQMEQWEPPSKAEEVQHALIHVQFEPDIAVAEEYCAKLLEEYTNSPEVLGRIHLALASNLGSGRHPYQPATIAKMIEASRKALQYPLEVLDACRAYDFIAYGLQMEARKDRNVPETPAQRREILDVYLTCLKLILSKATTLQKQEVPGVPMMDVLYVVTPGQDLEDNPEYKADMAEHEAQMKAHDEAKTANELVDHYEQLKRGIVGPYLGASAEEITEEGEKIMPGAPVLKELVEAVKKSNAPPPPARTNLPPNSPSNRVNGPPPATNGPAPAPAPAPANPQSAIRNPQSSIGRAVDAAAPICRETLEAQRDRFLRDRA
jgi:hypothetical protein